MSALLQLLMDTLPAGVAPLQLPTTRHENWRYSALRSLETAASKWTRGTAQSALSASVLAPTLGLVPHDLLAATGAKTQDCQLGGMHTTRSAFSIAAAASPAGEIELSGTQLFVCAPQPAQFSQRFIRFVVPANSHATLLIEHANQQDTNGFTNLLLQLEVQAEASLNVVHVQRASDNAAIMQRTEAALHSGAALNCFELQLGASWSRHEIEIALLAPGAFAQTSILAQLARRQHVDVQLCLRHLAANCRSNTRAKAIADARARFVLNGKIAVAVGADGTDAQLQTNNLLLSELAEIDVKPELEIDAEEVSCSHGATVGKLDEQALFYLRARGIDAAQARAMLIHAFAAELLTRIPDAAQQRALAQLLNDPQQITNLDSQ